MDQRHPAILNNYMSLKFTLFSLTILQGFILFSQKEDYVWPLGDSNNTKDSSKYNGFDIDFSSRYLKFIKHSKPIPKEYIYEINNHLVSIYDTKGNLILYSNGCYFLDENDNIVPGSDSLNPIYDYYESCYKVGPRGLEIPQTGILLPNPGNPYYFDYFHLETTAKVEKSCNGLIY